MGPAKRCSATDLFTALTSPTMKQLTVWSITNCMILLQDRASSLCFGETCYGSCQEMFCDRPVHSTDLTNNETTDCIEYY